MWQSFFYRLENLKVVLEYILGRIPINAASVARHSHRMILLYAIWGHIWERNHIYAHFMSTCYLQSEFGHLGPRAFSTKTNLTKHLQINTGENRINAAFVKRLFCRIVHLKVIWENTAVKKLLNLTIVSKFSQVILIL